MTRRFCSRDASVRLASDAVPTARSRAALLLAGILTVVIMTPGCSDRLTDPEGGEWIVTRIELPEHITAQAGDTLSVRAKVWLATGREWIGAPLQWSTADSTVAGFAGVGNLGGMRAVALADGQTRIEARHGDVVGVTAFTVQGPAPVFSAVSVAGQPVAGGSAIAAAGPNVSVAATLTVPPGASPVREVTLCRGTSTTWSCSGLLRSELAPGASDRVEMTGEFVTDGRYEVWLEAKQANGTRTSSPHVLVDVTVVAPTIRILRINGEPLVAGIVAQATGVLEFDVELTVPAGASAGPEVVAVFGPDFRQFGGQRVVPAMQPGETRVVRVTAHVAPAGEYDVALRAVPFAVEHAATVSVSNSDAAPPVIRVLSHQDGAVVTEPYVTIRFDVEDDGSGLHEESLLWDWSIQTGPGSSSGACGVGSSGLSFSAPVFQVERTRSNATCGVVDRPLLPGANRIVITARDNALNVAVDTLTLFYQPPASSAPGRQVPAPVRRPIRTRR